jgi:hypothetical protein
METRRKRVAPAAGIVSNALVAALLAAAPTVASAGTPRAVQATKPRTTATATMTVTDANVADRVLAARTKSDQKALAAYYKAKAAGEDERIEHFDKLLHAYMKLQGKQMEPLQRHARALLKAARMFKQRYELLAQTHLNLAYEQE